MDALPDWSVLPSGGIVVILAWFIIRVMNQTSRSQESYQSVLTAARKSHRDEIKELQKSHKEEIRELQDRIKGLDDLVTELRLREKAAREAQWRAEDQVAEYRRELGIPSGPT